MAVASNCWQQQLTVPSLLQGYKLISKIYVPDVGYLSISDSRSWSYWSAGVTEEIALAAVEEKKKKPSPHSFGQYEGKKDTKTSILPDKYTHKYWTQDASSKADDKPFHPGAVAESAGIKDLVRTMGGCHKTDPVTCRKSPRASC